MRYRGFRLAISWLVSGLILVACGPAAIPAPGQPDIGALRPPTEAPTEVPLPTSAIATPPAAYATQDAARQTAIVARATTNPFPSAGPSTVLTGQPSTVTTQRDGLTLELRLAKAAYLAGEGGRGEVNLRNGGPETVFLTGGGAHYSETALLDERGHQSAPWPWSPVSMPGGPRLLQELSPGQVLTDVLTFQMPPIDQVADHTYVLWAEVRFSRPAPDQPQGPDNLWLRLETGPIPMQVSLPSPDQALLAQLEADRDGWWLQVTDANGKVPPGPFWGMLEAASVHGAHARPLEDSPDGIWSGNWDPYLSQDGAQVAVRAWVCAPGYVTAAANQTVPGEGDATREFYAGEPATHQSSATLEAAQAATDFPLYRPELLPDGATLQDVQIDTWTFDEGRRVDIGQSYRLPGGFWLWFAQAATTDPWAGFGYGLARYDPEARILAVGEATGYATQRFGWWLLEWMCDGVGLEIRAPVEVLSLDDLLAVAIGVRSPEGTCPLAPTATPQASPAPPTPTPALSPTTGPAPAPIGLSAPTLAGLVSQPDGLGVVDFGDGPDFVIAVVTGIFGAPDSQSGWRVPSLPASKPH